MAAIDLIVLGMLKKEELSAYDMQKLVEYRNISKWVKISTPSIYKKVIQLEQKGFISSRLEKGREYAGKSSVFFDRKREKEFKKLMHEISKKPVHMFLDFNAVIVNLESMPKEEQKECLDEIGMNTDILLKYLEDNLEWKEKAEGVPATGMAVLHQQIRLAQAIKAWIADLKKSLF